MNNVNMVYTVKILLDLPEEILVNIFSKVIFNFRLLNKLCQKICDDNNLSNKTYVFYSLNFFINQYENKICDQSFNNCVKTGEFEIIKYLVKENKFIKDDFEILHNAAIRGDLEIIKFLIHNEINFCEFTFTGAAQNGSLENMKWLKENICPWDEHTFSNAAQNGNLENIK